MRTKPKIKVLFNDSHVNLTNPNITPQGGPARFAQNFTHYFNIKYKDIELISILFSHNQKDQKVYKKKTSLNHDFYEVVYPREKLSSSYNKNYTKKQYLEYLNPWLKVVSDILDEAKPDLIFLNGFSLSNWLILEIGSSKKIPIIVQHAGIWKKELISSKASFSSSIKKIFSSFEKEIIQKANHQIFLNLFSREEFYRVHKISFDKKISLKTSIIPLPIEVKKVKKVSIHEKKLYNLGMVARWDKIKNHSAIDRLASYYKNNHIDNNINVVTQWSEQLVSNFKERYQRKVNIIKPMTPQELKKFYDWQDIILIPSRFDVSPTVLMESLLRGKPVLISNKTGWISQYYKLGLGKMTFHPNASAKTINSVIGELINKKDHYLKLFNKFQNIIITEHDEKIVFDQYYNLFLKIYDLSK